ncbi:MAG TPA: tetratricopeptide repeat protein [Alphaproteobacteria bacterium]|nr:tetratricopeptide repeat protein [Alphaproteobacteria bacterium]
MSNRLSPAVGLLVRATAAIMALVVPIIFAEAATASPEDLRSKPDLSAPDLAKGVEAMKRGSDYLAFAIFEPYAERGNPVAEANLANLYLRGRGTEKNPQVARLLFETAAMRGLPLAYGQLGALYQQGEGAPADPKLALDWYRRGAAAGDSVSLFGLGLMYQNGLGVRADLLQAAKWYRMAAARGHARAKFVLGVMHFQGQGVAKNLIEAYKWFALAQAALPPGLDRDRSAKAASLIEASLPHNELEAARASARSWKPEE